MLKKEIVIATVAFAAIALASHILVQGSNGEGTASSGARSGQFRHGVQSSTDGKHVVFQGKLAFAEHHAGVAIHMGTPNELSANPPTVHFAGPGTLSRHGLHPVHGRVIVAASDNRNPHRPHNQPDRFGIEFRDQHSNVLYAFHGDVTHGDLSVFRRHAH